MLYTKICEMLSIKYPILLAGMGYISRAELVATVSEAGGLGVIGAFGLSSEELLNDVKQVKQLTDKPFAVDVVFPEVGDRLSSLTEERIKDIAGDKPVSELVWNVLNYVPHILNQQLDIVVEEKVPVLISGLGNPADFILRARACGITVGALIGTVRQAQRLEEAGVDFIIAQGYDAGGHTGRIGTMSLVPQVVDAVNVPVLAAGGLGDGRGLVAALALGAEGVVMGTRFVATTEAAGHENYKERITHSTERDWVITRSYTGKTIRTARNRWTEEWANKEDEALPFPLQFIKAGEKVVPGGWLGGDIEYGLCPAGQIAGMIKEIKSAKKVMQDIVDEAEKILHKWAIVSEAESSAQEGK